MRNIFSKKTAQRLIGVALGTGLAIGAYHLASDIQ
jgi:hypothetical protein